MERREHRPQPEFYSFEDVFQFENYAYDPYRWDVGRKLMTDQISEELDCRDGGEWRKKAEEHRRECSRRQLFSRIVREDIQAEIVRALTSYGYELGNIQEVKERVPEVINTLTKSHFLRSDSINHPDYRLDENMKEVVAETMFMGVFYRMHDEDIEGLRKLSNGE